LPGGAVVDAPVELNAATRWRAAFARVGEWALIAGPLLILGQMARLSIQRHTLAFDAANAYLPGARNLLHGVSPYHAADIARGVAFASPPIAGFLFAPFTAMPHTAAEAAMAIAMLAAALVALLALGVRDWRCYAVLSISAPLVDEFQTANLSALVALCVALLWRWRDRPVAAGAAAGLPVALKLLGWPMILFLLLTRRFRAAAWAVAFAAGGIVLPWAAVGFAGARGYPHLLRSLELAERGQVYSVGALVARLAPWTAADAVTYAIGAALVVVAWRSRSSAGAFVACVAATLVLTPVVWMHYFVLLFVAIAVVSPRLVPLWALPLALWMSAHEGPAHAWQNVFVLVVEAAVFASAFRAASPARPAGAISPETAWAAAD
jgi:Glycosyltransferase family 87